MGDSNYWFNGAKRHLIGEPDDRPHATTPYIELFFVFASDSSKELAAIPFTQFKDMPILSESSLGTWWPLIATPAQQRRKVLPANDGKHLLRWPFQSEKEPDEPAASDVRRSFLSKPDLEKRYKERAGLSAKVDLTTSGDRSKDTEKGERLRDFELVGARLYTGKTQLWIAFSPICST